MKKKSLKKPLDSARDKQEEKDIKENIRWFSKFSLEKRFKIAFDQIKSIKILRGMTIKKHGSS